MGSNRSHRRKLTLAKRTLGALVVLAAGACGEPGPQATQQPAPTVLFRGCRALRETTEGTICFPTAWSRTVIWVEGPGCGDFQLVEDNRPVAVEATAVRGGCRLQRMDQSSLVRSTLALKQASTNKTLWQIAVNRSMPRLFELTDRIQERTGIDLETAAEELRRPLHPGESPEEQSDRAYALALVLSRQGNLDAALAALAESRELALRAGYRSFAFQAAHESFVRLLDQGLVDEASRMLQEARELITPQFSLDQNLFLRDSGRLAHVTDQLVEAERWIAQSAESAERVNATSNIDVVMPRWADLLIDLDRTEEAKRLLSVLTAQLGTMSDCSKADRLVNLGMLQLKLAQPAQEAPPTSLVAGVSPAAQLFGQSLELRAKCADNEFLAVAYSGLAQDSFLSGKSAAALDYVKKARETPGLEQKDQMDLLEIEARIAVREGRPEEALTLFAALDKMSEAHPNNQRALYRCKVVFGTLEAMKALNTVNAAIVDEAKACLTSGASKFGGVDRRSFVQRARDAGIQP